MALSQEQTWAQLQENLRRKRQTQGLHAARQNQGQRKGNNRYKKALPVPLPRIADSPSDAPLRGSHYPVIPPVANDRFYNDDVFSLEGYNSETDLSEEDFSWLQYPSSQPASPPYPHIGSTQGHYTKPQARRDPWNSSTRFVGEPRPFIDFGADGPPRKHGYQQGRFGRSGHRREGGRGRGSRVGGLKRRHVWNDPRDEKAWLEDESATVVQKHYRGYRTRKNLNLLHGLQNPNFATSFMHYFLKDILQNDLVLDVACEVLVEERSRKQQERRPLSRPMREPIEYNPVDDVRFWLEAFNRPDVYKPVATNILQEVIRTETHTVISDGINELLVDYFETKDVADVTKDIVADTVLEILPDVLEESINEIFLETTVEELIDEETQKYACIFLQETLMRGAVPPNLDEKQLEIQEVARIAETFFLDSSLLDHLLSLLTLSGKVWETSEYADRFMDDHLLEILLSQYIGILHNRTATQDCVPLKRLHEKIVTDVALDTILDELTQQFEEDLLDFDECETS